MKASRMKAESGQASLHHSLHCPCCRRREPPILAADAQAGLQGCARYELLGLLHKRQRKQALTSPRLLRLMRLARMEASKRQQRGLDPSRQQTSHQVLQGRMLSGQEGWDAMQVERTFLQQESTRWDLTQLRCAPMPTSAGLVRRRDSGWVHRTAWTARTTPQQYRLVTLVLNPRCR
jgi:hypothetical protein